MKSARRTPPAAPAPQKTVRVSATARIRASREQVWAVLTDFSSMHRWFAGLTAVRLEDRRLFEVACPQGQGTEE